MPSLTDRIALVTGAGRGIGRAIARGLAEEGARVALVARSGDELATVASAITRLGRQALPITADLADRQAPEQILRDVRKQWGDVEILVNNAGVGSSYDPKALVDFSDDFWDLSFALNVTAPYLLIKRVLPSMIERRWGRIVNIASICASVPTFHGVAYTATKHALHGLTKVAALESAPFGVTVNSVCPGVTRSQMNDRRLEYDSQRLGKSIAELEALASPLGRRLEPDEVASLAVYLCRDEARAITGQALNVCGGALMA